MINLMQVLGGQQFWAGTEDSLLSLINAYEPQNFEALLRMAEKQRDEQLRALAERKSIRGLKLPNDKTVAEMTSGEMLALFDQRRRDVDDEEEDLEEKYMFHSATYKAEDGVAVIGINGPLVNSDKWYLGFTGQVGYPHLVDQLMRAYNDESVTGVVMAMNTPGGAVTGVSGVREVIQAIDASKPIITSASGQLASAGYWIGSASRSIMADSMTSVGSIGILSNHTEMSKREEMMGIKTTVLRRGEYKALASQHEPLSDKARAQIEQSMDYLYGAFTSDVALARKVSHDYVISHMAEGRVFWGPQAKAVNLIDDMGDLRDAVAKSKQLGQNAGHSRPGLPV